MRAKHSLMRLCALAASLAIAAAGISGCADKPAASGVVEIELVEYKQEAHSVFEKIEQMFNDTHEDIHLTISSPNEAALLLKTRFVRGDYPDIIGIGGDMDYANFLDADLFADISDFEGLAEIKPEYLQIVKDLELVPKDGIYAMPFVANCAGVLYNKDMFAEHGWTIPETWSEFTALCERIQAEGIQPLYAGYKDTWTCLAPWNALAVSLAPSDTCAMVNKGLTTFSVEYRETAEKIKTILEYTEPNPYAYGYNDACTAFANGDSAMYAIGSYAVAQILSVNPDMNIDSFTLPANEDASENVLNSGVDLQFMVMQACEDKEAAYEVLRFLNSDEVIELYLSEQSAIPCKEGDFELPTMLDGMREYIDAGRICDFQDHHYPREMSVESMIQTFMLDESEEAMDTFLNKFDTNWERYNRDLIRRLRESEEE